MHIKYLEDLVKMQTLSRSEWGLRFCILTNSRWCSCCWSKEQGTRSKLPANEDNSQGGKSIHLNLDSEQKWKKKKPLQKFWNYWLTTLCLCLITHYQHGPKMPKGSILYKVDPSQGEVLPTHGKSRSKSSVEKYPLNSCLMQVSRENTSKIWGNKPSQARVSEINQ